MCVCAAIFFSAMLGLSGAIVAVPLLAVTRIILHRTDHPLAKRAVSIIRDTPKDELVALQVRKTLAGFFDVAAFSR